MNRFHLQMLRIPTRQFMNLLVKQSTLSPSYSSLFILSRQYNSNQTFSAKQSSSPSSTKNTITTTTTKRDIPSFKNILFIALVGTGIFVFAVDSLDRTQKKTTFSNSEYSNMMKGLRRRVTLFNPGEIDVNLLYPNRNDMSSSKKILDQLKVDSNMIIDPLEVIESFRNDPNGRFEAILNDIKSVHGDKEYIHHLPDKMLVSLLRDYIKDHCKIGDKITIINFPTIMSDAIHFENEITQIKQIYIPKGEKNSDICKYFETVDKVTFIQ